MEKLNLADIHIPAIHMSDISKTDMFVTCYWTIARQLFLLAKQRKGKPDALGEFLQTCLTDFDQGMYSLVEYAMTADSSKLPAHNEEGLEAFNLELSLILYDTQSLLQYSALNHSTVREIRDIALELHLPSEVYLASSDLAKALDIRVSDNEEIGKAMTRIMDYIFSHFVYTQEQSDGALNLEHMLHLMELIGRCGLSLTRYKTLIQNVDKQTFLEMARKDLLQCVLMGFYSDEELESLSLGLMPYEIANTLRTGFKKQLVTTRIDYKQHLIARIVRTLGL